MLSDLQRKTLGKQGYQVKTDFFFLFNYKKIQKFSFFFRSNRLLVRIRLWKCVDGRKRNCVVVVVVINILFMALRKKKKKLLQKRYFFCVKLNEILKNTVHINVWKWLHQWLVQINVFFGNKLNINNNNNIFCFLFSMQLETS